jgi:uncharacterized protein YdcH (DUF465 family)
MIPPPNTPRLEALLDERDHLRIKISLAEKDGRTAEEEIAQLRRKLLRLEHDILRHWDAQDRQG